MFSLIHSRSFISLFQGVHLRGKHAPYILTAPLPSQNQLSKMPVNQLPERTAQNPGGEEWLRHLPDTNLRPHPKPETLCRWHHVKMAHCKPGISTQLPTGVSSDLTHPGPVKSESLGPRHCCFLEAPLENQKANRFGFYCLRPFAWVAELKPESDASSQVRWCLSPGHTTVITDMPRGLLSVPLSKLQRAWTNPNSTLSLSGARLSALQTLSHFTPHDTLCHVGITSVFQVTKLRSVC